jgi:hypothetical protein
MLRMYSVCYVPVSVCQIIYHVHNSLVVNDLASFLYMCISMCNTQALIYSFIFRRQQVVVAVCTSDCVC